jgi:hypothetical protein
MVKRGFDCYKMSVAVGIHILGVLMLLSVGQYGTLVVSRPIGSFHPYIGHKDPLGRVEV